MLPKSARFNILASILVVLIAGCGGSGLSCGGCGDQPLPGGKLPVDQTIEGGGQIRVTPAGFTKISTLLRSVVGDALGGGTCVPGGSIGNAGGTLGTGTYYCSDNQGTCAPGCDVNVNIDSLSVMPQGNTLNIATQFDIGATVPLDYQIIGIGGSCDMTVAANNLNIDADIALDIKPTTGALDVHLDSINNISFDLNFANCGLVSGLLNLIGDVLSFLENYLGGFINGLLEPVIDNLLQSLLPDPLGIEGMTDVGALLAGVSPSTEAQLETRLIPGGYVSLSGGGMSLGLITGFNADEDITTRTPALDSEPSYCVPPIPSPDFAAAPASLPRQPQRQTFILAPANEFNGNPNPSSDLAMGISETTLDLLGHHAVTSGAMCLGIGTETVAQLNLGTLGILVPSLASLASTQGNDPMLLVTRPQRALDFSIGAGTTASPALTLHIEDLEVDFYAFLYERYTRAFTISLNMDVGINLEITQPPGGAATITPVLVGLSSSDIGIEVSNSEFVRETPDNLEAILPTVFDLILPLLADGLPAIAVPEFAGFQLSNLVVKKVTTAQDDFLAINASLQGSPAMATLARSAGPRTQAFVDSLTIQRNVGIDVLAADVAAPSLRTVNTPMPAVIRTALEEHNAADLPTIEINAADVDALGRRLEWSWRIAGGLWREFTTPVAGMLAVSDRAFAWQGKYEIELRSRVIASPRTTTSGASLVSAIVDSVAPAIAADKATWAGDVFTVPAFDIVSGQTLTWAFGRPSAEMPATQWTNSASVSRAELSLLVENGEIAVYVKDEAGNVATALARTVDEQPASGGCQSSNGTAGGVTLVAFTAVMLLGVGGLRRKASGLARRAWANKGSVTGAMALWLGASVATSMMPGCDCGGDPAGQVCETVDDCVGVCNGNQIAFCIDNTCVCSDDIPAGKIGPYSDIAASQDGVYWVSAYAQSHGDLVLANPELPGPIANNQWEWVDGVPDVAPIIENSEIRGGIDAPGDDVGMYTSIAVTPTGEPRVSYFDREHGALKFAAKVDGTWQTHTVDDGGGNSIAGIYTAISLRTDDQRPGIAYTSYVTEGTTVTAEVWFASAQTATPASASDWTKFKVDSAVLPAADEANPDPFPLPGGLGLFVDVARGLDQAPVVVYYDRTNGDLKVARLDAVTGTFLPPQTVDGVGSDAGWSPSVAIGADGTIHVAYVASTHIDLQYWNSATNSIQIIDDGYRIVGTTEDGLPKPEYHFVGDDVTITLDNGKPVVVYQDATTQELLEARRGTDNMWTRATIAGNESPFVGGFGFYASSAVSSNRLAVSTWVIDLPAAKNWVEVFLRNLSND